LEKEEVLSTLERFLFIEIQQAELYGTQARRVDHYHLSKAFEHFQKTEEQHVQEIKKMYKYISGKKDSLNEDKSTFGDSVKSMTSIAGTILEATGIINMLKFDIMAEKKAVSDYKAFLSKVKDPELKQLLWDNLIDEESHVAYMDAKLKELNPHIE
jgi:bacterioferritin